MSLKQTAISASLFCAFLLISPAQATDFSNEYRAYDTAFAANDFKAALKHLELAYPLGEQKFGKNSLNFANLSFNLANTLRQVYPPHYPEHKVHSERALALYAAGIAIYQQHPEASPTELIMHFLNATDVTDDSAQKLAFVDSALAVASKQADPAILAATQLRVFEIISRTDKYRERHNSMLKEAYAYFEEHAQAHPQQKLRATFLMAQLRYAYKKLDQAEPLLLDVIQQTKQLDFSHPMALAAHARLVDLYERKGKSAEATPHCIAIGSMTPWDENQDPVPLFRKEPAYPMNEARRGISGFAKFKFTITAEGAVTNIEIVETDGSKTFGTHGKEALAKWRYAPKFENGQPVNTTTMVQLDFRMAR